MLLASLLGVHTTNYICAIRNCLFSVEGALQILEKSYEDRRNDPLLRHMMPRKYGDSRAIDRIHVNTHLLSRETLDNQLGILVNPHSRGG